MGKKIHSGKDVQRGNYNIHNQVRTWEFWGVTEYGKKFHEYIKIKTSRQSKAKTFIEKKHGIKIDSCKDFGFRDVTEK